MYCHIVTSAVIEAVTEPHAMTEGDSYYVFNGAGSVGHISSGSPLCMTLVLNTNERSPVCLNIYP